MSYCFALSCDLPDLRMADASEPRATRKAKARKAIMAAKAEFDRQGLRYSQKDAAEALQAIFSLSEEAARTIAKEQKSDSIRLGNIPLKERVSREELDQFLKNWRKF